MIKNQLINFIKKIVWSFTLINGDCNLSPVMLWPQMEPRLTTETDSIQFQHSDPPQCFSGEGASPHPCNLKGTLTTRDNWRENLTIGRQFILQSDQAGDGLIAGVGSYLCILRGSEIGGQTFVRDVGIFRCNFQGAERLDRNIIIGRGVYQCNYQTPGQEQRVTQGVGWYVCLFTGTFKIEGIPENPQLGDVHSLDSFVEIVGSVSGTFDVDYFASRAQFLGLYQFGGQGQNQEFGFVQLLENFKFTANGTSSESVQSRNSKSEALANVEQLGTVHYSIQGRDFERGRAQINNIVGSHVTRQYEKSPHRFNLFISRYDYNGRHLYGQNEDIVQIWSYYDYDLKAVGKSKIIDIDLLRGMIISEINLESGVIDFIQFILNFGFSVKDQDGGNGLFHLTGVYQTNTERSQDDLITDLFHLIIKLNYTLQNEERGSGSFQVYGIYNHYLYLQQERAGWVQSFVRYEKNYPGHFQSLWNPPGTKGTLSVNAAYEVNFPQIQFTNGFHDISFIYEINLQSFMKRFSNARDSLQFNLKSISQRNLMGVMTFSALYRCYRFGVGKGQKWVCYFQAYILYKFNINQVDRHEGGGHEVTILAQVLQEVRNDNIVNDSMTVERYF